MVAYSNISPMHGPALQKMIEAFPHAKKENNGWWENKDNPRFGFQEQEDGSIRIGVFTGRTREEILAMGGLTLSDISPHGYHRTFVRDSLDIHDLAIAKRIDWHLLWSYGVEGGYTYHNRKYVKIVYHLADGTPHTKVKVRKAISGSYKHCWDEGTPGQLIPYGLERLETARNAEYLLIGEGETDAWTCWAHNIPYLGIPGVSIYKVLQGIDLNDIPAIYILTEPDQMKSLINNGQGFYKSIHNSLRFEGYTGEIYCINFQQATGHKDPSDLHITLWDTHHVEEFPTIIQRAREQAIPANDQMERDQKSDDKKPAATVYQIKPWNIEESKILAYLADNEYGDGGLFSEVFNGQVCYDRTAKEWYLWNGHFWKKDTKGVVELLISGEMGAIYLRVCANLNPQLASIIAQIERNSTPELIAERTRIEELMEALRKRANTLRTAKRNKNVQMFIQSLLSVTSNMWDAHPWLLATPNGVIDLKTGEFREGNPEDYIRTHCPTLWENIDTPCPRFEQFLQEIFADKTDRDELISFIQRLFGQAIVGLVNQHVFPIFYGEEGRNGKDTLLSIIKHVLGVLTGAVSNDVFLAQDKSRTAGAATPHLVDLQGKRLVWGSETKQGDKFNVAQVKQITGGGDISARKNFGEQYSFTPSHTLLLMTNSKPHADARDKAFWTRACLVEFGMRFVENPTARNERKADTSIVDDMKQEASGILAWLVRGCLQWQNDGLNTPESVRMATDQYMNDEDTVLQFMNACCVVKDSAKTSGERLYDTYKDWCKGNGITGMSGIQFGKDIAKRFEKKRTRLGMEYVGIGILSKNEEESVYSTHGSVYSKSKPYTQDETAPQADSEEPESTSVYSVYSKTQSVPQNIIKDPLRGESLGFTIHTIHTDSDETTPQADPEAFSYPTQPYTNPTLTLHNPTHNFKVGEWVYSPDGYGQVTYSSDFSVTLDIMNIAYHYSGDIVIRGLYRKEPDKE